MRTSTSRMRVHPRPGRYTPRRNQSGGCIIDQLTLDTVLNRLSIYIVLGGLFVLGLGPWIWGILKS